MLFCHIPGTGLGFLVALRSALLSAFLTAMFRATCGNKGKPLHGSARQLTSRMGGFKLSKDRLPSSGFYETTSRGLASCPISSAVGLELAEEFKYP